MKVRIGNDIRLNLTIRGPKNYNGENLKEVRCNLINTTANRAFFNEECKCCRNKTPQCCGGACCGCHGRKKHCGCGCPSYWVYPHTPCDPAFGQGPLPPNYGHDCVKCKRHGIPCIGINDGYWDRSLGSSIYYDPLNKVMGAPVFDADFTFLAPSKADKTTNRIQVYFPASDQLMCGDYKLVVSTVVYESGWGRCDLHTYTVDYGNVFSLVDDESGLYGDIDYDCDTNELINGETDDTPDQGYIGFVNSNDVDVVKSYINDTEKFSAKDNIFDTHVITNETDGYAYLWICTRKPIGTVYTTSGISVPIEDPIHSDDDPLYYYMCPNRLINGIEFNITVEPKS
jgi:hypothetical protein